VPLGKLVAPAIFGEECLVPHVFPQELGGGAGPGRHAFTVRAAESSGGPGSMPGGGAVVLRLAPEDLNALPHAVARRLQQLARSTAAASMGARQGLSILPTPSESPAATTAPTAAAPAPSKRLAPPPIQTSRSEGAAAGYHREEDSVPSVGRHATDKHPGSGDAHEGGDGDRDIGGRGHGYGEISQSVIPGNDEAEAGGAFRTRRGAAGVGLGGGGDRLREVGPEAAQPQSQRRTLAPLLSVEQGRQRGNRPASAVDARRYLDLSSGGSVSSSGPAVAARPASAGLLGSMTRAGHAPGLEHVLTIERSSASVHSAWEAPSAEASYEYHHAAALAQGRYRQDKSQAQHRGGGRGGAGGGNMFGRPMRDLPNGLHARIRMPRFGEQMRLRPVINRAAATPATVSYSYASRQNKGPVVRQTKKSLAMAADNAHRRNPLTGYGGNSGGRLMSGEMTTSGQPMLGFTDPVPLTAFGGGGGGGGAGGNPWHGLGPALRTGRPRPASAAPDFGRPGGITRERSVGGFKGVPAPVLRPRTGGMWRPAPEDIYGDNLGGLGDDPSGFFSGPGASVRTRGVLSEVRVDNGQQQQQQRRAGFGIGPGVRARPQSAAAATATATTTATATGARSRLPLRGMFGDVKVPSQTFGAAWGVSDLAELGLR
jgi:hypothetical protein